MSSILDVAQEAFAQINDLVKDKTISEDDERRATDSIQKLADKYSAEVDTLLADKEMDLMEI